MLQKSEEQIDRSGKRGKDPIATAELPCHLDKKRNSVGAST